jgi:biotin synthase-like enzyme
LNISFQEALERAAVGKELSKADLIALLSADEEESVELFQLADEVRAKFVGEEIHLRGIIEFSNYCKRNCKYCVLWKNCGMLCIPTPGTKIKLKLTWRSALSP